MFDARVLFLAWRRTHIIPSGPCLSRLCATTDSFRARLFRSWIRVRGMHLELESFYVLGHSKVHLFPLLAMARRTDVLAFCLWCEDLFFLDAFPRATTSQLHALSRSTHPRQHVVRSDTSSKVPLLPLPRPRSLPLFTTFVSFNARLPCHKRRLLFHRRATRVFEAVLTSSIAWTGWRIPSDPT